MNSWEKDELERWEYLESIKDKEEFTQEECDKLIYCGILEDDPSANGYFIKPCLKFIGVNTVSEKILSYYFNGNLKEKVGALKLFYHVRQEITVLNPNTDEYFTDTKALENNKLEYERRSKILLPEFLNCKNPILRFFFKWALPSDNYRKYFKNVPETSEDLINSIKNNTEYYKQLKELFPYWELE